VLSIQPLGHQGVIHTPRMTSAFIDRSKNAPEHRNALGFAFGIGGLGGSLLQCLLDGQAGLHFSFAGQALLQQSVGMDGVGGGILFQLQGANPNLTLTLLFHSSEKCESRIWVLHFSHRYFRQDPSKPVLSYAEQAIVAFVLRLKL